MGGVHEGTVVGGNVQRVVGGGRTVEGEDVGGRLGRGSGSGNGTR